MFPSSKLAALVGRWALVALLMVPAVRSRADEHPSSEERSKIEAVLRGLGFVRWGEIEREDHGRAWEVDDARTADGKKYDVRLATEDLRELSRREDD